MTDWKEQNYADPWIIISCHNTFVNRYAVAKDKMIYWTQFYWNDLAFVCLTYFLLYLPMEPLNQGRSIGYLWPTM